MGLQERTTYLEDDWDDNALTGRTSPEEGYFLHPSDGLTGAGDYEPGDALKGVYRPEWTVSSGSASVSNGELILGVDGSVDKVQTPTDFTAGSWSFDWVASASPSSGNSYLFLVNHKQASDDIEITIESSGGGGDLNIRKRNGGTTTILVGSSWGVDTANHTNEATRSSYSDFELFFDGASQGTATDTFLPATRTTGFQSDWDAEFRADNLVVK